MNESELNRESIYNALYENNMSMYFTLDSEFCIVAVNRLGAENLGYNPDEMILQKFINFIHPEHQKSILEQLEFCLVNPLQIFQWEFKMCRRDGEIICVRDTARTLSDQSPEHILVSCDDITVRKQAQKSLDEIIAGYKVESLSRLAGGIAHDLNNLLTGIIGNIPLLKASVDSSDTAYEKIVDIENISLKAKDLADKLFVFSTGGQPYRSPQSARTLVKQCLDSATNAREIHYKISEQADLDTVNVDPEQIKRVFFNIISNGCEAMSETCELEVNIRNITAKENPTMSGESGGYIEISFTDHGVGISDEDLAKVFDPYFTTKSKGDGLGLSTAQAIVKNHGGEIAIESVPGLETTVHVYLPVDKHAEIDQPQQPADTAAADGKLLSGKRVLVMDDEEFIRKVAGNILEHLGCEVDFAEEGSEAIKKYEDSLKSENRFDFVILDLTVHEGVGGQDALAKLKEIDPDVKAFLSSGYTHDTAMLNFGQSGFVGVINKPYEIEDFIKSFCDVMGA